MHGKVADDKKIIMHVFLGMIEGNQNVKPGNKKVRVLCNHGIKNTVDLLGR